MKVEALVLMAVVVVVRRAAAAARMSGVSCMFACDGEDFGVCDGSASRGQD